MSCNKLLKEAIEGIDFRYKLDDTLANLDPKQKFSPVQLEGYLLKQGVSPKEIKQSGILTATKGTTEPQTIATWIKINELQPEHRLNSVNSLGEYSSITLDTKGEGNPTYKETLTTIRQPKENKPSMPHFEYDVKNLTREADIPRVLELKAKIKDIQSELQAKGKTDRMIEMENLKKELSNIGPKQPETLLGWRRTHEDTINGKKTTVLNEFQSDWAQSERAERGSFESSTGKSNPDKIIADFPMSEKKHHQFQIVGALDEAIKNGTNRVAIPINRKNELAGTAGVTKFYDSLNKSILPEIRKKLEKQGMRIKISREDYGLPKLEKDSFSINGRYIDNSVDKHISKENQKLYLDFYNKVTGENMSSLDTVFAYRNRTSVINILNSAPSNTLHILEIEHIPNTQVRWDIYSMLGSIGLAGLADKLNEATKEQ